MASIFETLVGKEEVSGGQQFFNLASNGSKKGEKINSKTSTISKKEARIPKDELEFAYTADSFNFNAVKKETYIIINMAIILPICEILFLIIAFLFLRGAAEILGAILTFLRSFVFLIFMFFDCRIQ